MCRWVSVFVITISLCEFSDQNHFQSLINVVIILTNYGIDVYVTIATDDDIENSVMNNIINWSEHSSIEGAYG